MRNILRVILSGLRIVRIRGLMSAAKPLEQAEAVG